MELSRNRMVEEMSLEDAQEKGHRELVDEYAPGTSAKQRANLGQRVGIRRNQESTTLVYLGFYR